MAAHRSVRVYREQNKSAIKFENLLFNVWAEAPFRDGYVLVHADDEETAREEVFYVFGSKWPNLYTEENFRPEYFPAGQIGKTLETSPTES